MTMKEFMESLPDEERGALLYFLHGQVKALEVMEKGFSSYSDLRHAVWELYSELEQADRSNE